MSDIELVRYALNVASDGESWDAFNRILSENERLREELAAAQKDAERYRWIRDNHDK